MSDAGGGERAGGRHVIKETQRDNETGENEECAGGGRTNALPPAAAELICSISLPAVKGRLAPPESVGEECAFDAGPR